MSSWLKSSNTTPQAEPNATAQELYLPTRIRGLYTSRPIKSLPVHIKIAIRQPGANNLQVEWSSSWDETRKACDDGVTIPTVKDAADTTINIHGKPGARVPGIFIASEEVEKPLVVVWALEGGTRTIIQVQPVGKEGNQERDEAEEDEYVMVER